MRLIYRLLLEGEAAIINGFGFGGGNASALFRRWTEELPGLSAGGGT
ncbi:hypothetical protein [Mesorhizobium captivum]|uniref:Uncharacterized protein n=1 Tax=Mesorhizobium captivum TaxID=3072319 RepID=A0ABU4YZ43_9HYPH|nr:MULTISPECIES: hypothetical protein [unclassified Mesorhizobium]MDX8444758.1 hypothetical protein [Mesorhizobium sp. VK3C]MDX8491124.1 hypothetical protein [Mesorhizobium sp. VK22B]MDX8504790.1 hypothetical protein [Mesorhizobium sp. VK22E]